MGNSSLDSSGFGSPGAGRSGVDRLEPGPVRPGGGGPLDAGALRSELVGGGLWTSVTVVPSTGSTNADLVAAGGPEGQVLVAEEQTVGRGRMGRSWQSQPGAALTFSVLLRPDRVPAERCGWLPLLAGVAVARAVRACSGLHAMLKWPNDVLIADGKVAGILAEQTADGAVVIGIGVNVETAADALPSGPGGLRGTSIAIEGGRLSRQRLLVEMLGQLARNYAAFRENPDPDATGLLAEYRTLSATLGQQIRAELPEGRTLTGTATDVDADGRLLVAVSEAAPGAASDGVSGAVSGAVPGTVSGAVTALSAGDVVHIR